MSRTIQKNASTQTNANAVNASQNIDGKKDVEVLYQKMGNRWFAFSVVEGEVFMGSISQEEIDALELREQAGSGPFEISGNS